MKYTVILFLFLSIKVYCQDDVWDTRHQKVVLLHQQGEYAKAIAFSDSLLQLVDKNATSNQQILTTILHNRGKSKVQLGQYAGAKADFQRALHYVNQSNTTPSSSLLEAYGALGEVYLLQGKLDSAEHYFLQSDVVFDAIQNRDTTYYQQHFYSVVSAFLNNNNHKAMLYKRKGQIEKGITTLLFQKELILALYPENYTSNRQYQITVNNLSQYYAMQENYTEALSYALSYKKEVFSSGTLLDSLHAMQNLAGIYSNLQKLDSAEFYYTQCLDLVHKSSYNNGHLHLVLLNNLGDFYAGQEQYNKAIPYLEEAYELHIAGLNIEPNILHTLLFNLAEAHRNALSYPMADSIYSLLTQRIVKDYQQNFLYLSEDEKLSYYQRDADILTSYSNFALEIAGLLPLQEGPTPYTNPAIASELLNIHLNTKGKILNESKKTQSQILQSKTPETIAHYKQWINLKNELSNLLYQEQYDKNKIAAVQTKVEAEEKWLIRNVKRFKNTYHAPLIQWQDIQKNLAPEEAFVALVRMVDGLVYGVFILNAETKEYPHFTLIMSKKDLLLEQQVLQYYQNSVHYHLQDTLSYSMYWQPLKTALQSISKTGALPKTTYILNDGIFNQVNWNGLYDQEKKNYVLDQTHITLVTSYKSLKEQHKTHPSNFNNSAVLVGNPTFQEPEKFPPLPGTQTEIDSIQAILKANQWHVDYFSGAQATESVVKNARNMQVLHIASHGYYAPMQHSHQSMVHNMIGSGIALAAPISLSPNANNGRLSAYEACALNLDNTNLVVLSACETGLGTLNASEGVYGLQRAMGIAGAKFTLLSLWKVDDHVTQLLMQEFYRLYVQHNSIPIAFNQAQKNIRQQYPAPFYWSAFVLSQN